MLKITALAALLAAAAPASLALASPSHSSRYARLDARYDRGGMDDRWRPRAADDFGPRHYRPTWVSLASSMDIAGRGRDTIRVGDPNTFTQLRMQVASGVARIDRVIVRFADGSSQVAELDRVLDDRNDLLELPLDGNNRRIAQITVFGDGDRCGGLQLYGI
jgi:hypothetical protein